MLKLDKILVVILVVLLGIVSAQKKTVVARGLEYDYTLEPSINATQEVKRDYLLKLVNRVRAAQPNVTLGALTIDTRLNDIAQKHSEDMLKRQFFDHKNPEGKGPQDRANATGFTSPVGENIVATTNLTQCHVNLMNSISHYTNTNFDYWTRVGFGIAFTKNYWYQVYYVTVLFSIRDFAVNPITSAEYELKRKEMKTYIESVNPGKTEIPQLSTHIKNWLEAGQVGKFYDYLTTKQYKYHPYMIYYTSWAYWTPNMIPTFRNRKAFVGLRTVDKRYAFAMRSNNRSQVTAIVAFSP